MVGSEQTGADDQASNDSSEPWWHSKLIVALITVIGASVAPMTTWVSSQQQRRLENDRSKTAYQLQLQQQEHAARVEFFEKVVAPSSSMTPEARLDALRYFSTVLSDPTLRKWATDEYVALDALVKERKQAELARADEADKAAEAAERARKGLARLESEQTAAGQDADAALKQEIDRNAREAKQRTEAAEKARAQVELVERKLAASVPRAALDKPPDATPAPQVAAKPAAEPLAIAFAARREYVTKSSAADYFRFSVEIDAPAATLQRIARVDYVFDHPTFTQKQYSSDDRARRFAVSYLGWGCLTDVRAKLLLVDGTSVDRRFDMCALLR